MKLYWIKLDIEFGNPGSTGLLMGIGVTAIDENDAIGLIKKNFFNNSSIPHVSEIKIVESLDDLDKYHILPNIGNPFLRGVWFPRI